MNAAASSRAGQGLLGVAVVAGAILCGVALAQLPAEVASEARHWVLIALLAAMTLTVIVYVARREDLLSPLGIVALTVFVYYVCLLYTSPSPRDS